MKIWRPYTQMFGALDQEFVTSASGAHIHLHDGRKIFDGISSWWLITHGHCQPEIAAAIGAQAKKIDQVVFANFTHEPAEELVEELKSVLPEKLGAVFFSDNGSTSVEVAMKMAYQYCRLRGQNSKNKFCAFESSYHGDTIGTMSVTADGVFTKSYADLRLEVLRCKQGQASHDPIEAWIGDLSVKLGEHHREIVAVILEPILQGAGGMIVWPTAAVEKVCALCREYGVLLIFDEVMTGFGRTGKMFAFEHLKLVPDFVCLSKGLTGGSLPLALTLSSREIYDAFLSEDPTRMFFHGHSFTANAISCAAACASVKLFKNTPVLRKIEAIGEAHRRAIAKLRETLPLKDARVIGAVGAIELETNSNYAGPQSREIYSRCLEQGLFTRPLGQVLYLMPPYCSDAAEVEWAWDVIAASTKPRR